jgi:site-specific recombinase XerD
MTALAPELSRFLREHLPRDQRASPHTCDAYAYSFQLLVIFAARQLQKAPCGLEVEDIGVPMILSFLEHIERDRGNSARSRNARLAAIKSFFRFLEYRVPACLDQSLRVRAIPVKKTDQTLVTSLTRPEIQALIDAPDPKTIYDARDRAMLHLAFSAGLRVSELVGLQLDQLELRSPATIHVIGKGRRERVLPLWKEGVIALKAWLAVRRQRHDGALFLNAAGFAMTRSGFEYILAKHVITAAQSLPSIAEKRVTPHVLRHSCAQHMLRATRDIRKVALWLGHANIQSTEVYLRADPTDKLEALAAASSPTLQPGTFSPPDKLIAMLKETRHSNYAE